MTSSTNPNRQIEPLSVQDTYAPKSICFGCGPSNGMGLKIKSFAASDGFVCRWRPGPHHEAFPGVLNGGIIGAILDCHSNWCAAVHLMSVRGEPTPPCTVTANYTIELKRPTPSNTDLHLMARVLAADSTRASVEATLTALGKVCATCTGTFVAVGAGHPAYHRW